MALTLTCGFVSPADPPACQIGVPYSHQFVASGGSGNYTYYLFYGGADLNGGLTLSDSGLLSGTPNTSKFTAADLAQGYKTVGFWVFVFDNGTLERVGISCGLGFYQNCLPLTPSGTPTVGTVALPYSFTYSVDFGIAPFAFALTGGALPPGLTLNPDGSVTGTPTLDGLYTFFVTVTGSGDPTNNVATFTSQIQIGPTGASTFVNNAQLYFFAYGFLTAMAIDCGDPPDGEVGIAYAHLFPFFPGSGTAPFDFEITAGALPPGLSLSFATGNLTGVPTTPGPFAFTVTVTDSGVVAPQSASVECSITIDAPAISIDCNNPPPGTVGQPYSHPLVVTGGTPPFSYALTGGALPPGLNLGLLTGIISGVPTAAGTFSFTVTVTDAFDLTASVTCSITIYPKEFFNGSTEQLICERDYPWSIPPADRTPWRKEFSIAAPAVGVITQIWQFEIPDGFYLVVDRIRHGYGPGLLVEGSGSIIWTIDVNFPIGSPQATWRPLAQFTGSVGSLKRPWPVGPLLFRGNDTLRYKVQITDPLVPVGPPNIVYALAEGWLYPMARYT